MESNERPAQVVLPRKQHALVLDVVERWRERGIVDEATGARLRNSLVVSRFDWQRTARYAFLIAVVCLVIAVGGMLADRVLMALLARIFAAPPIAKCLFFFALAAAIFAGGLVLRRKHPHRIYRNEAVCFLGVLALAASIGFFGEAIDTGSGHYSLLFLLAAILYALIGLWLQSALVWVFGLLALGAWMGTETGYLSGGGAYFLGMNYPLRFVFFGAGLALLGIAGQHHRVRSSASSFESRLFALSPQTKVVGLLHLFVALWIMSIFGNYGDMVSWERTRQYELFHWSVLFGAVAVAAIWYGLRWDDGVLRGFGLTFLGINLYTRFFEYFWDSLHKAVFFALLAVSFWFVGSRAEAIWHLGERKERQ